MTIFLFSNSNNKDFNNILIKSMFMDYLNQITTQDTNKDILLIIITIMKICQKIKKIKNFNKGEFIK